MSVSLSQMNSLDQVWSLRTLSGEGVNLPEQPRKGEIAEIGTRHLDLLNSRTSPDSASPHGPSEVTVSSAHISISVFPSSPSPNLLSYPIFRDSSVWKVSSSSGVSSPSPHPPPSFTSAEIPLLTTLLIDCE